MVLLKSEGWQLKSQEEQVFQFKGRKEKKNECPSLKEVRPENVHFLRRRSDFLFYLGL